ncbi:Cu-Zn family superoxide dismutase [Roseivirga pacifica]|uniref:Superoxide dismutase, Cu-Zn family n=1 Tax=Roseivirga pacifica TaxID=1267423 RepID=A0A1I0QIP7_9BACT|nr:superoxide dismutase family protein [Roseivirga pacifica]RKQ42889.1 Cu-Zn family superoxide dismutase [Roseivirga pacifica]SEW26834.1 superoxide dismutase, Cu-Zn family [Roseivirga pacifica]
MRSFNNNMFTIALGIVTALVACTQVKEQKNDAPENEIPSLKPNKEFKVVTTELISRSGSELKGQVTFSELEEGKINLSVKLSGVKPGEHAVHIHEKGDCSAADGKSAGGHWNPLDVAHGNRMESETFHKGDIGNITVGEDGTGTLMLDVAGWTIGGSDVSNILGKAVIVHAGPDDFTSQPSGAAGARVGCGVIEK